MASNETKNPRRAQMRGPGGPGGAMTGEKAKIGRASCRERV